MRSSQSNSPVSKSNSNRVAIRRRRFRIPLFEPLEPRLALAFSGWTVTGTTAVSVTMTTDHDQLFASEWYHTGSNSFYLGLWDSETSFISQASPSWTSQPSGILAANVTSLSVVCLDGADIVDLSAMDLDHFSGLSWTYIKGDEGSDQLKGTDTHDEIRGDDGYDTIKAGDGADTLYGGPDKDTINGDKGVDVIEGNAGEDTIHGGDGNDEIRGNDGNDTIFGEGGADLIYGGADNDFISGWDGNDELYGEGGDDWIAGEAGNDTISGGNGADILWSGTGGVADQPWDGNGGTAGWHDMKGTGPASDGACDVEDNHPECTGGPVAVNDTYSVSHNANIFELIVSAPGVLFNDTPIFMDMSAMTATLVQPPLHHEYSPGGLGAGGNFYYNPVNSFVGTDVFYYRVVQSGIASKNIGVVTINVTNAAPAAADDPFMTMKNTPANWNVLMNDSDLDGDDKDIARIITNPTHGTIDVDYETGNVTYTPNAGFWGTDGFTYKATDGIAESEEASAVITIMDMLTLDGNEIVGSTASTLSTDDVAGLAREASHRWVTAGVDPGTMQEEFQGLRIEVLDLPGTALAAVGAGVLVIDVNAAGHGWFLDPTPNNDREFLRIVADTARQAVLNSPARGKVDLLTVLMHETGHLLGLEHSTSNHGVMSEVLPIGTRRLPSHDDADLAILSFMDDHDRQHRRR